jgi:hypothetical protein
VWKARHDITNALTFRVHSELVSAGMAVSFVNALHTMFAQRALLMPGFRSRAESDTEAA